MFANWFTRVIANGDAGGGGATALPYSTEYTTPGTQTVAIPAGAATVTVECYGSGANATYVNGVQSTCGGGGAGYSRRDTYSVSGLTALYLSIPDAPASGSGVLGDDAFVKENTAGGTTICLAKGGGTVVGSYVGGAAADGTGDVKFSGGDGHNVATENCGGGGGAGPDGDGGDGGSGTAGTAGGGLAGVGSNGITTSASACGGGGGVRSNGGTPRVGARGGIKLSWAAASGLLTEDITNLVTELGDRIILEQP